MTKLAYFDCFSGASGDMILGALLDAGLSFEALQAEVSKLALPAGAFSIEAHKVQRAQTDFPEPTARPEHPASLDPPARPDLLDLLAPQVPTAHRERSDQPARPDRRELTVLTALSGRRDPLDRPGRRVRQGRSARTASSWWKSRCISGSRSIKIF